MNAATLAVCLGLLCYGALAVEFKQSALPYDADALEPAIDEETMILHHDTHHAGYVRRLNTAVEAIDGEAANYDLDELLRELVNLELPENVTTSIRNNGGGHWNHELYWKVMTPESSLSDMSKELSAQISTHFGKVEDLKTEFLGAAASVFGSGWAWLCVDEELGDLSVVTTPNQDNPLMEGFVETTCKPILGVDVWEHAYYLKRQAGRKDYLEAFWGLIDWEEVSKNYAEASK
ncbi:hypothetical protein BSKO_06019 [Bryopsis sp. KO-2023]|nr:hypothetical protein BSKO_06019 [Bryopsis sp. KO-2023]